MACRVRDFTYQETIYKRRLRTIIIRVEKSIYSTEKHSLLTIGRPGEFEVVLRGIFEQFDEDQEHFVMLVLDGAHELLGFKRLASGTQTSVMVDKTLIFRNAILLGGKAIIVAHNHPDGSLTPSPQDVVLTKSLIEAGQILNIEVLDHVIVSPKGTCASIKEREPHMFPPHKTDTSIS
ncbi:MAG TPA: JAB domain-containing protein [Polyangia bacterium]|jgi:DNA repair protein RadC|nr:JAB domain-containing protein [Polyangia bacterium]